MGIRARDPSPNRKPLHRYSEHPEPKLHGKRVPGNSRNAYSLTAINTVFLIGFGIGTLVGSQFHEVAGVSQSYSRVLMKLIEAPSDLQQQQQHETETVTVTAPAAVAIRGAVEKEANKIQEVEQIDASVIQNMEFYEMYRKNATYVAHVDEMISNVEQSYKDVCRRMLMGEPLTFGQGFQEWYIYHNIEDYKYRGWGDGWYLDIGTNDATEISNTLFFDKCLGWNGICAEPNSMYHPGIKKERSCQLVPNCILGKQKEVSASGEQALLSVMNTPADGGPTFQCLGVLDVVGTMLDPRPTKIDVVNIDVEGAEGDILRCFPFEDLPVTNWLVETNKQPQVSVDWFFHRHGYDAVTTFGDSSNGGFFLDTLYTKKHNKEILPTHTPMGLGKFLSVEIAGESRTLNERAGFPYYMWPANNQHVVGSDPARGKDWLKC